MLTLPDTDTALSTTVDTSSETTTEPVLVQRLELSTPWAQTPHWQAQIGYQKTDDTWVAAQVKDNAPTLTPGNFTEQTTQSIALDAPVILNPVSIAKPWGQELWFSGIEERGESTISQGTTTMPLSHYLALAPLRLVRRAAPLLLKILDPNPTYNNGCLYVETHNTKQEVYVVTQVNSNAWPNGEGAIRLGIDQNKRRAYPNDDAFRAAFLLAVQRYERVRRALDQKTDTAVTAAQKNALHNEEHASRIDMESFTALKPLGVGDVVQVSPHIPHSLQQGVTVFEFQTPTFERNIISFNQEVLTQNHWDSEYAIKHMSLASPPVPTLETLTSQPDLCIERIVHFDDFEVQRVTLNRRGYACEPHESYLMVAVIKGELEVACAAGNVALAANGDSQAALIPASALNTQLYTQSQEAVVLLARPTAQAAGTITQTSSPHISTEAGS